MNITRYKQSGFIIKIGQVIPMHYEKTPETKVEWEKLANS